MLWGVDNHLVRAHAVHLVVQAFRLAAHIAFNAQRGKLVRDHANRPTRTVFRRRRPAIELRTVGQNLRRRFAFVSVAEGTKASLHLYPIS